MIKHSEPADFSSNNSLISKGISSLSKVLDEDKDQNKSIIDNSNPKIKQQLKKSTTQIFPSVGAFYFYIWKFIILLANCIIVAQVKPTLAEELLKKENNTPNVRFINFTMLDNNN